MKTILKEILVHNNCELDKFMQKSECINSLTDISHECFVTLAFTPKGRKVLFITRIIQNNWYESIKDTEFIVKCLLSKYNYSLKELIIILHTYFSSVELENFYEINIHSENILNKISISNLENKLKK